MTATVFDPVAHTAALLTVLDAIADLNVYDAEVPKTPPLDPDGRAHPYAVVYAGAATNERANLTGNSTTYRWPFQITVVGGDRQRCGWAAKAVTGAIVDLRLTVTGFETGLITHEPGPQMSRDDSPTPPRHYQPLLFSLTSTPG